MSHGSIAVVLTLAAAVAFGAGLSSQAVQHGNPGHGEWNRQAAAKYLDDRMDAWFARGSKLRTGNGQTTCISCHTPVPYALARPALRQSIGQSAPTPQEARLIDETIRRVETYGAHELGNDFDEIKKLESRGTEAVLNALVLTSADAAAHRPQASAPTRKALEELWLTQRPDGAWYWLQFGLEPFEGVDAYYYGAALSALAVGGVPDLSTDQAAKSGIDKLRGYLKNNYERQNLFNRTWLLLASTRLTGVLTSLQRDELITDIGRRQQGDGGWSVMSLGRWRWARNDEPFNPPGTLDQALLTKSDGYATGLIVYALRTAGLSTTHPAVHRGLEWLRNNQIEIRAGEHVWTAWRAHSLNFDREHGGTKGEPWRRLFMSDSATALAVLALLTPE
jgi:squalene-hopene/tetraprenyl-beta-curcumene cyclase